MPGEIQDVDPSLARRNIHQRLHAVMLECGYIKKDTGFSSKPDDKGVARDAVVAEVRPFLLKNGVIAYTTQTAGEHRVTERKSSSGTPLSLYVGTYATHFVNIDDPKDEVVISHQAEGQDYGDKAPGKAATYAEKLNFVKGLCLETGIKDEGRNPGDGDDAGANDGGDKKAIKTPQAKAADANTATQKAKAAVEDTSPASAGYVEMLKKAATDKNLLDSTTKKLKAGGYEWDKPIPKSVVAKALAQVNAAKAVAREPGQEG
jgi:hypothetical protein